MPANMQREVGQRIATLRHARRMTQEDLARASFVSLSMVRKIERGDRYPSDDTLESIAATLNVDPSRIVEGNTLTCNLHGWQWNLDNGRCLTSKGHELRSAKR